MRPLRSPVVIAAALCLLALALGLAWAAPKVMKASATPDTVKAGETAKLACELEDPQSTVARVTATVREVPYLSVSMNKGPDGVWTFAIPVPKSAPAATYHLELEFYGADGKLLSMDGPDTIVVPLTVTSADGQAAPAEPPAARASDARPELVSTEVTDEAGGKIILRSPYRNYPQWYKGQLHCHTTNSDGRLTPAQLEAKYRAVGNDWMAISDHERITPDPAAEGGQEVGAFVTAEEHGTAEGHINIIGASGLVTFPLAQEAIDQAVAKQGMVMINHPDWDANFDQRELDRLVGYHFMEIMNAGCLSDGKEDGTRAWDYVLGKGKVVWGVATDDYHGAPAVGLGFVMVNAPELSPAAILANLRGGNFCSSQGPAMELALDGNVLSVKSAEKGVAFFRGPAGLAFQVVDLEPGKETAHYRIKGDEGYVRVEFLRLSDHKRAWSQPVFVEKP